MGRGGPLTQTNKIFITLKLTKLIVNKNVITELSQYYKAVQFI